MAVNMQTTVQTTVPTPRCCLPHPTSTYRYTRTCDRKQMYWTTRTMARLPIQKLSEVLLLLWPRLDFVVHASEHKWRAFAHVGRDRGRLMETGYMCAPREPLMSTSQTCISHKPQKTKLTLVTLRRLLRMAAPTTRTTTPTVTMAVCAGDSIEDTHPHPRTHVWNDCGEFDETPSHQI
jgi:hypothetical protein